MGGYGSLEKLFKPSHISESRDLFDIVFMDEVSYSNYCSLFRSCIINGILSLRSFFVCVFFLVLDILWLPKRERDREREGVGAIHLMKNSF